MNNIDDQLIAFCQRENFKSYVRQAVNNELFWRDFLNKWNIDDMIDNKLNAKLPKNIKKEVQRIIPNLIEIKILQYITDKFPGQVNKEINNQIPSYLNNNYQMQEILRNHSSELNSQLEICARRILGELVKDPQYQEIMNTHLHEMERKYDNKVGEISLNAAIQISNNDKTFNDELNKMKSKVNNNLLNLKQELEKINSLNKKIDELEINDSINKQKIGNLKWGMGGICVVFLSAIVGVYAYINK
jgi:hypothetical protein